MADTLPPPSLISRTRDFSSISLCQGKRGEGEEGRNEGEERKRALGMERGKERVLYL